MDGKFTKKVVKEFVGSVLVSVAQGLANDGIVSLNGFGRLKVNTRKARSIFNPQTKKKMRVPATKTVTFKAYPNLRAFVR